VKKTRQNRKLEPGSDFIETGKALVVPIMVTNDEAAIAIAAIMMAPPVVPTAVVLVEAGAGTIISVAVIAIVAANVDADAGRIGKGRSADREGRCRGECVSKLSHVFLLLRFHQ
jgi:hypothetical protein